MVETLQIRQLDEAASVDLAGADWAVFQLEESAGGDMQKVRGEKLFRAIANVTEKTTRSDDDLLAVITAAGELRRMQRENFLPPVATAAEVSTPTGTDVRLFTPANITAIAAAQAGSGTGITQAQAELLIATWALRTSPTGTVPSARLALVATDIPDIGADKITSGTLNNDRLTLTDATIPVLPASKITAGEFASSRIPDHLPAEKSSWVGTQAEFDALTAGDFVDGLFYSIHED